ncbi:hypothetical protein U9M48_027802 [Paspalum notatum var. saurae]|uniref:4-coumarate--CoA ligase n=1 Tax=Paspalum notatum var. saurae TaxID=547442 RepID=A0AAQ3TZJ9_PASNO
MAAAPAPADARSGYSAATGTFRSLRPPVPLPPPEAPLSLPAFVASLLPSLPPAHPAFLDAATGESLSYPAFLSRARALAGALRRRGLARGDVAFVLAPAGLDVPVLYFALLTLGAVVCPANPALTPAEVAHLAALSGASVAFAVSRTAAKLPPGLPAVLLDSDEFRASLQSNGGGDDTASIVTVRQSDTAAIQFSSGTTGRVKAAALPHRGFIAMAAGARALFGRPRPGRERTLLTAPLFHSMGFAFVMRGVALGQTTVVATDAVARAGVKGVVAAAERWAVAEMTAAPPLVVAFAKDATCRLPALERIICGGAPLPVSAAERFRRRFPDVDLCMGLKIYTVEWVDCSLRLLTSFLSRPEKTFVVVLAHTFQGYGSTEGGGISLMIGREECAHVGSSGRISENVEVKIVDPDTGKPLGVGQKGELLVRGPAVMSGYVGDEEANAATFDSEGWLKSGDLCYIDQDGFLFVVDRLKELIKYKGYQVPPAELELVLQSLPEVVDAAVMPYPHEEAGQIPIALVVRQPGSKVTEAQVMDHVAKRVAPYKKIRKVLFVDSIPKSPAGKILRRQLTNYVQFGTVSRM